MYILISNNCLAADFYKLNNMQFNHMFMWSTIYADDFIKFYENYMNNDFSRVELIRKKDDNKRFGLNVDNCFNVFYMHYRYDANCKTPKKTDIDVFYYKNYEYVYSAYIKRLARFNRSDNDLFVLITYSFLRMGSK